LRPSFKVAEALTPDNKTIELYDPAEFRKSSKNGLGNLKKVLSALKLGGWILVGLTAAIIAAMIFSVARK
jgi:hypothetical protein